MEIEVNETGGDVVVFPLLSGWNHSFVDNSSFLDPEEIMPPADDTASISNPDWTQLLVQILYGIVCLVGLVGNSLVIYVVLRFSKMWTVTNLFLLNLAIADELFLLGIPFLVTTLRLGSWPFGNLACKAYFTVTSINQIASSMFLLVMSAARYLAVCHPLSGLKWRRSPLLVAKLVALAAWTLCALMVVPIFRYANTLTFEDTTNCNIFWPDTAGWDGKEVFVLYTLMLSFVAPLFLITIFYGLIIRKLLTASPVLRPTPGPPETARDDGGKKSKATKLVLIVIAVYFLCWAPYWTAQLILIFAPQIFSAHDSGVRLFLLMFSGILSYSNSAMNPILYSFLSENFKRSFLKACGFYARTSRLRDATHTT